jgi:hypothetical protein
VLSTGAAGGVVVVVVEVGLDMMIVVVVSSIILLVYDVCCCKKRLQEKRTKRFLCLIIFGLENIFWTNFASRKNFRNEKNRKENGTQLLMVMSAKRNHKFLDTFLFFLSDQF